eukprot:3239976-Amphidinium_carterae.1
MGKTLEALERRKRKREFRKELKDYAKGKGGKDYPQQQPWKGYGKGGKGKYGKQPYYEKGKAKGKGGYYNYGKPKGYNYGKGKDKGNGGKPKGPPLPSNYNNDWKGKKGGKGKGGKYTDIVRYYCGKPGHTSDKCWWNGQLYNIDQPQPI